MSKKKKTNRPAGKKPVRSKKKKAPKSKKGKKGKKQKKQLKKAPAKVLDPVPEPEPQEQVPPNPFDQKHLIVKKDDDEKTGSNDKQDKDERVVISSKLKGRKDNPVVTQNITHFHTTSKEDAMDIFCEHIKEKLGMTSGGVKTFRYLYNQVQDNIGVNAENMSIIVDKADCMAKAQYTSIQSVFNGINELIEKEIIAKSGKTGVYFLNPHFFRPVDFLVITEHYTV